jgi:Deoxycytidine deaminase
MIVTAAKVLELREEHGLIENLSERERRNPEGVGLEVRLGTAYELSSDGFLGTERRDTPDSEEVLNEGEWLDIESGDYYLVETMEEVDVPAKPVKLDGTEAHLMPDVYPRSTLQRSGIYFKGTNTNPGYSGPLIFGVKNVSSRDFRIEQGSRIAEIVFKQAYGGLERAYEGQWQGGRVSTDSEEKQV